MQTKKVALYGLLVALAMLLSWVETLIPMTALVPGMKIGLTNLVIMVALYELGERDAFILSMVRILLVSMTFGNMAALMYSLAGGILSFVVMALLKRTGAFSMTGVSVAGGVSHNIGQIIVASFVLDTMLAGYLPVLLITGVGAGIVIGFLGAEVAKRIHGMMGRLKN